MIQASLSLRLLRTVLAIAIVCWIGGCEQQKPADATLHTALVLAVGGRGDNSVNDSAYAGLKEAEAKLRVNVSYVEPRAATEFVDHLRRFVRERAQLIIGIGFSMKEPMEQVAKESPGTMFAIIDVPAQGTNIMSLVFRENEGAFLAGALAAMMTQTEKVCFLGGMDIPLLRKWNRGFEEGAKRISPRVVTEVRFLDSTVKGFSDPILGKRVALSMFRGGCDVILQVTGGSAHGVYLAAKEVNRYVIGSDQNQDDQAKGLVLTSVVRKLEPIIVDAIGKQKSGTSKGGIFSYGIKERGVTLTDFQYSKDVIGPEKLARLKQLEDDIAASRISVP